MRSSYFPFRRSGCVLLAAIALSACDQDVADDEAVGELGNGTFRYECVNSSDPLCPTGMSATDFPDRIGTDGVFDVSFELLEDDPLIVTRIESVADDIVDERNERFQALAPGVVALLAKRTSNGRVLDIVHVTVVEVDGIRVESEGEPARLVLSTGERTEFRAIALDADRSVLAGAREFVWRGSDQRILRLEVASPTAAMRVYALAPGTVTLEVTTGIVSTTLELTVEGSPVVDGGTLGEGGTDGGPLVTDGSILVDAATDARPPDSGGIGSPDGAMVQDASDGGGP